MKKIIAVGASLFLVIVSANSQEEKKEPPPPPPKPKEEVKYNVVKEEKVKDVFLKSFYPFLPTIKYL